MKKIVLSCLTLVVLSLQAVAQKPHFVWMDHVGSTEGATSGQSVMADKDGNVYTLGLFEGEVDFDPGDSVTHLYSKGGKDVFLQKLDSNGVFIWARSFGGAEDDYGNTLALDKNGDVLVVGSFRQVLTFDYDGKITDVNSKGAEDIFVAKFHSGGEFQWVKTMGGRFSDLGLSIAIDNEHNIYTTGSFNLTVDFDPNGGKHEITSLGSADGFIQKLDSAGNFVWVKTISGPGYNYGSCVKVDEHENVYVTGSFEEKVDLDPDLTKTNAFLSKGEEDLFVLKLDLNGEAVWAKTIQGSSEVSGFSLALDEKQQVYVIGIFKGTLKLDINGKSVKHKSKGKEDVIIFKQDDKGELVWSKTIGGKGSDYGNGIYIDYHGDVFTIGSFEGKVDFDPTNKGYMINGVGKEDVFIHKMDNDGNFEWADKIGGEGHDLGNAIFIDYLGQIYATGSFEKMVTIQLDDETKKVSSTGKEDVFIIK